MYPYIKLFNISLPTYGLCMCIAIFLCAVLTFQKAHTRKVDCNDLLIISAVSIGFGLISGGLLYILITYDLKEIATHIINGNFSFFRQQGIVFYGGLIGGAIAAIITSKLLKFDVRELEICGVVYFPLGHAIGRIGCLLAGCCYGLPYHGIFAAYTNLNPEYGTYFPIQIVEAAFNLLITAILLYYSKKERAAYHIICCYLVMYSVLRFFLEFFRGDAIRGSFLVFSTSQWISLILFVTALSGLFYKAKQRHA